MENILQLMIQFLGLAWARENVNIVEKYRLPPGGPFYWYGLTLIPTWISNYMPRKVCGEITYLFLSFNGATIEVMEWIINFIPHLIMDVIIYPFWDQS